MYDLIGDIHGHAAELKSLLTMMGYEEAEGVPGDAIDQTPHEPVASHILPGYDGEKPVFVGHYWMKGEPAPLSDHIACLDYSVAAGNSGKLCAYRFAGESKLRKANFEWVTNG